LTGHRAAARSPFRGMVPIRSSRPNWHGQSLKLIFCQTIIARIRG
jgi:hypothetical protein